MTDLLNVAAVCGQEFDATLVAHAAEVPLEEVLGTFDTALAARIVDEDIVRPGRYLFANALIWQTLYHDMPRGTRTRLHARVGNGLEASARQRNVAALLARHFQQALPLVGAEKAIEYTAQAGRDALAEFAFDEAAARFETALGLLEEHTPKDTAGRVELLIDRAGALVYVDEREGVKAALMAVEQARVDGSASQFGRAVAAFVEPTYGTAAYPDQTVRLFDEARSVLGTTNPALRARLLAYESFKYAVHQLRGRDGRALAEESVVLSRDAGDSLTLADALFALSGQSRRHARGYDPTRDRERARSPRPNCGWPRIGVRPTRPCRGADGAGPG